MTPEQAKTLAAVQRRVDSARAGGRPDYETQATLIAEGWPARAVIMAIKGQAHGQA